MKKLVSYSVLAALILPAAAMAADNGRFYVGGKSYGCGDEPTTFKFSDNTYVQAIGQSTFMGQNRGQFARYKCNAHWSPTYDDHWDVFGTNWCSNSDVKQAGVSGVKYELIGPDGTNYGSAGAAAAGGCIKGTRTGASSGSSSSSSSSSSGSSSSSSSGSSSSSSPSSSSSSSSRGTAVAVGAAAGAVAGPAGVVAGAAAVAASSSPKLNDDIFSLNGETHGCNLSSLSYATHKHSGGVVVQTKGRVELKGSSYVNGAFRCDVGAVNDVWQPLATQWCSDSEVKESGVSGVSYELIAPNGKGISGYWGNGACLKGTKSGSSNGGGNSGGGNGGASSTPGSSSSAVCGASGFRLSGLNQYPRDDEFLYTTEAAWNSARNATRNGPYSVSGGLVYECDNETGCANSHDVVMPAGHVFKGQKVTQSMKYKCVAPFGFANDYWMPIGPADNGNGGNNGGGNNGGGNNGGGNNGGGNGGGSTPKTPKTPKTPATPATPTTPGDPCAAAGGTLTNGVCACPNDAQGYPQDFNGAICERTMIVKLCLSASATATWNFVSGSCVCNQEGYNFDTATGKCVESPEAKAAREAAEAKNKIKSAHDAISALTNAKKTVWRDEEGKFNTARLASDSIAGVVLGTTGALVTSHLVKKKQTEDGFEALECTIGGQTVAGWGDEFSVGIGE